MEAHIASVRKCHKPAPIQEEPSDTEAVDIDLLETIMMTLMI
jgi:hypothetical protein